MKKLMILAISAILAANISAQEAKAQKGECKKAQKECKFNKEERIEMDIKLLTDELYLSDEQAAKFAVTYREFIAAKEKLNEQFRKEFGKNLNERQVERVLRFHGPRPCGPKPEFQGEKGPKPEFRGERGPRQDFQGAPKKHAPVKEAKKE